MSLRIQNDPATNAAASDVNRAGQTSAVSSGAGKAGNKTGNTGGDQVDVSPATEAISAGISAQNLQRASRVTQLSALYARGEYSVNAATISSAIVGNAVASSAAGRA